MTASARNRWPAGEVAGTLLAAGVATLGAVLVLGGQKPAFLIAAPIGVIGMVAAARRPVVTLAIMVVVEVTNASGVLAPRTGLPLFMASGFLGVVAIALALRDPALRARLNGWTVFCAGLVVLFLMTQAVAVVGSVDKTTSIGSLRRIAIDLTFALIVLMLIQISGRPWTVAAAIVIPFTVLSLLTLVDQYAFGGTASFGGFSTVTEASGVGITTLRFGGPLPDSNFWGRHLIMGLPLSAALLTRALRSDRRLVAVGWAATIFAQLAGIYLTQSRGTFVSAGLAMVVWFVASGRSLRRRGLLMLPVAVLLLAVPGVGNRLVGTVEDLLHGQATVAVDPSVLGRLAAQQEAGMMFEERPYFGFGPGTFPGEVVNFAGRVPLAVREPTDAPHNLYLEFGAESGILGLVGWSVMILGFICVPILAIIVAPRSRDRVLAAAALAAVIGWSVSSIGLHLAYLRTLGVALALAGALAPMWPPPAAALRTLRHGVAVWAAAVGIGLATMWLFVLGCSSAGVTASQRMTLVPVGQVNGWYAYAMDIRSRIEMLPTVALLMDDEHSPVRITADPVRGLLTFTVSADNATQARDQLQVAAANGDTLLRSAIGYQQYSLETVDSMQIEPTNLHARAVPFIGGAIGAGTALVSGLLLTRVLARQREESAPVKVAVPQGVS